MEKFIKSNATASFIINVVMNTAIPFLILRHAKGVYLKEGDLLLLPNILGAVFLSAFITTLVTFFLMTQKRKTGAIDLPIHPNTPWFSKALLVGFGIALGWSLLAFLVLKMIQMQLDNIEISRNTVLMMTAIIGSLIAYATAFIAANRASKLK
jgi:hypothetical protein